MSTQHLFQEDNTNLRQTRAHPEVSSVSFEPTDFSITGLLHVLKADMGSSDIHFIPRLTQYRIFQRIP